MKKFLLILLGLVVVLIGAALVLPFVIPTETYKQQLTAQVERATGRQLSIQGPLQVSLLPSVALKAENVRFANAKGAAEPDMVKLKALEVELKVLPLLHGAVEVARFVLVEPEIHLEVAKDGRPNWQLGPKAAGEANPAPAGGGAAGGGSGLPVSEIKLGDIRIQNGTLTYSDATSGASERVEAINLSLQLPDLESRLQANGSLAYKDQTVKLDLTLDQPLAVIQGGRSPLRLAVDSKPARFSFEGLVTNGAEPAAAGGLDLSVPSIRELAAWLAEPLTFEGEGLKSLTIKGKLDGSPQRVALTDVAIGLDQIAAKGELVADLGGPLPKVNGRLDLGAVDLNPYLPPPATEGGPPAATGGQAAGGGPAPAGAGGTPAPAGQQPAPPATARGWSDEPIALPPLGGAEVGFELTLDSLRVRKLELGRTVLGLTLKGGTLEAALKEFALYDGHGSGTLRIAAPDGVPAISQKFRLEGLQALPFLSAAADFDRLEGTTSAELSTTTRGRSERQLVQNLNGEGKVTFLNGAIVGINLAAMVRNAANAFLNPEASETRKTDFAELGGTFKIKPGHPCQRRHAPAGAGAPGRRPRPDRSAQAHDRLSDRAQGGQDPRGPGRPAGGRGDPGAGDHPGALGRPEDHAGPLRRGRERAQEPGGGQAAARGSRRSGQGPQEGAQGRQEERRQRGPGREPEQSAGRRSAGAGRRRHAPRSRTRSPRSRSRSS